MRIRAIVVLETRLPIMAGRAPIMAAALQTVRATPVRATRLTRRVRLATIRTVRPPQIRAAHTINVAQLRSVLIILALRAATPRRSVNTLRHNSAATLRRLLILRQVAHTRHRHTLRLHPAADRPEADTLQVAVAAIEAAQDRTAAKPQVRIQVRIQHEKRPADSSGLFYL